MIPKDGLLSWPSSDPLLDLIESVHSEVVRHSLPTTDEVSYQEIEGWPRLLTSPVVQWLNGDDSVEPLTEYWNSERQKYYKPHNRDELRWVLNYEHRHLGAFGGEGAGKTVAGVIRDLERAKNGCSGALTSPDFEHFKSSFWLELQRWIPWHFVVERHRYKASREWEPSKPFWIMFETGSRFQLGGMKEDRVEKWEGPNLNFWHFDEPRRHKKAKAIKVIDGRVRIAGPSTSDYPQGMPPQWWLTTTPRKHWLFEYFGPWDSEDPDPRELFKRNTANIYMPVENNRENLAEGYIDERRQTLTEAEARVLMEAQWEDIEEGERFLPSMTWWDNLKADIPPLTKQEPMVLMLDAAVGRQTGYSDCFGMVGVTRHPNPEFRKDQIFIRYVRKWQARPGHKINFNEPREELRDLCDEFNIVQIGYDAYQLHDMTSQLAEENIAWFKEFSQGARRLQADRQLLDLIQEQRIWHDGNPNLREHIDNADKKLTDDGRRIRIVKREEALKIDLTVCLSMAAYECLRLNL